MQPTGVIIGVDLGWRWDTTAIVPIWEDEAGTFVVGDTSIIVPPRDGSATDYETIWSVIERLERALPAPNVRGRPRGRRRAACAADRLRARRDGDRALRRSRFRWRSPRNVWAEAISEKRIRLAEIPSSQDTCSPASPKPVGEGWRFVKPKLRTGSHRRRNRAGNGRLYWRRHR